MNIVWIFSKVYPESNHLGSTLTADKIVSLRSMWTYASLLLIDITILYLSIYLYIY